MNLYKQHFSISPYLYNTSILSGCEQLLYPDEPPDS